MLREIASHNLTPNEKYLSFNKAFGSIKHYVEHGNFLAAYVIAFSILEDRLLAAYIVCYKHQHGEELSLRKLDNASLHQLVGKLHYLKVIDSEFHKELVDINNQRNLLIHLMMWKLNEISAEVVNDVRLAITKIERLRRHFIKPPKAKQNKKNTVGEKYGK